MKMKKLVSITLALVLLVSVVAMASAQGTRVSAFQAINLGDSPARLDISYYNAMDAATNPGQLNCQDTVTDLASFKSVQYNQGAACGTSVSPCICDETSWSGSVVIESSQPIAVITNLNETVPPNVYYAGGAYGGIADTRTSDTVVLPFIMYDYAKFNTDFAIQNAGADEATVSLKFYKTGTTTVAKEVKDIKIKTGASYYRNQKTEDSSLGAGWSGVVVVESDQPVAAVVNETADPAKMGSSLILNYEGFAEGDDTLYMPFLCKEYAGFSTAFQLVAMEDGTAGTVSFYKAGESTASATLDFSKDKYGSVEWNMKTMDGYTTGSIGNDWSGAGVVTLTAGKAVVIVNQRGISKQGYKLGMTYSGVNNMYTKANLTFPFIIKQYAKKEWNTAFQVQNVGTAGKVKVYFDALDGSGFNNYEWTSAELAKYEALECNQLFDNCLGTQTLPKGWVGAVRIEAVDAGVKLAGICNERSPNVPDDNGLVYVGFPYD
jgi:hypothetical protein